MDTISEFLLGTEKTKFFFLSSYMHSPRRAALISHVFSLIGSKLMVTILMTFNKHKLNLMINKAEQ